MHVFRVPTNSVFKYKGEQYYYTNSKFYQSGTLDIKEHWEFGDVEFVRYLSEREVSILGQNIANCSTVTSFFSVLVLFVGFIIIAFMLGN